jgi:isopropylmalate/homocitrate/citramalate synthase
MHVTICDVGPRDGLQNEPETLPPSTRAELVNRLAAARLPRIEAASFVRADAVPQMAGAEEVVQAIERREGTEYSGLALNIRGYERLIAAGLDRVNFTLAATETFSRRNANQSLAEARAAAAEVIERSQVPVTLTISVAFGCPFEGRVDPGVVIEHVRRLAAAGADEVMLADTIGVGVPAQVRRLLPAALEASAGTPVGLHLHNTRNTGYANADAGLEHGATIFDASVGGLGGCPFAPRATGNIATEDLVYLLDGEGVETGVDLEALIAVSEWLGAELGRPLPGLVHRAGPFPGE